MARCNVHIQIEKEETNMFKIGANRITGIIVFLILLTVGAGTASAAEYWLVAAEVPPPGLTLPGAAAADAWGFCIEEDNDFTAIACTPSVPGPVLEVGGAGDISPNTLTVHLKNNLPVALDEYISLQILGQVLANNSGPVWTELDNPTPVANPRDSLNYTARVRSFAHEAAPGGGEATYVWGTVLKPFRVGSYLLTSGTNPAKQVQMGLYAAVKKDVAVGEAYPGVVYDKEIIMVYSEVDPAMQTAINAGTYGFHPDPVPAGWITSSLHRDPKYFLINGLAFDPTLPDGGGLDPINAADPVNAGDTVLIRFLNAGYETHVPQLLNMYMSLVAEDGNPHAYPKKRYGVQLPAGKIIDAVISMPNTIGRFSIHDATLNLTNNGAAAMGGMLAFVSTPPCIGDIEPVPPDKDVDGLDLLVLGNNFGADCSAVPCPGDIAPVGAPDDMVDALDLAALAEAFGRANCP